MYALFGKGENPLPLILSGDDGDGMENARKKAPQ